MNPIYKTFIPKGFSTINSYLMISNPEQLIEFLQKAFYAEIMNTSIIPETNQIANCILKIGESCIMVSQARGPFLNMRTSLYLYVDDVDQMHLRALENGAKEEFPPMDMDYQDRQSGIIDPSGNYWWISKRLKHENYK
jgi:uncharacterized glyoxalase superfamily protein PhnB